MGIYMIARLATNNGIICGHRLFDTATGKVVDLQNDRIRDIIGRGGRVDNLVLYDGVLNNDPEASRKYPIVREDGHVDNQNFVMTAKGADGLYEIVNYLGTAIMMPLESVCKIYKSGRAVNFKLYKSHDKYCVRVIEGRTGVEAVIGGAITEDGKPYTCNAVRKAKAEDVSPREIEKRDTSGENVAKVEDSTPKDEEKAETAPKKIVKRVIEETIVGEDVRKIGYGTYEIGNGLTEIQDGRFEGKGDLRVVKIAEGVTRIGDSAFYGCKNIEEITLPDSLKYIGKYAFSMCGMEGLLVPGGVEIIEEGAFANCGYLKEIIIGASVIDIGEHALSYCPALKRVVLFTDKIKKVAPYMCIGDVRLQYINMPESIENIGKQAFMNCERLGIHLKITELDEIGDKAFYNSGITSVSIRMCRRLGNLAFANCSKLKTVVFYKEIEQVGLKVFAGSKLVNYSSCKKLTIKKFEGASSI